MIEFQMNQIYYIKNQLKNINEFDEFINLKDDTLPIVFSRINTNTIKCSSCDKCASYVNINIANDYYCWFHRSIYENNN